MNNLSEKQFSLMQPLIREEMRIPDIAGMDDLISLMERSVNNEESFHLDLLLASLARMHTSVKLADAVRMAPAFERACLFMKGHAEGTEAAGDLDIFVAAFLIEYAQLLLPEFTGHDQGLNDLLVHILFKHEGLKDKKVQVASRDYKSYWELVKLALKKIKEKDTLPLLSTPTHRPAWIDPAVLVSRIEKYQKHNRKPEHMDFQIAVSRVALDRADEAIPLIKEKLTGEYRELLLFLFTPGALPKKPFTFQSVWMTAGLVKSPDTVYEEFADFPYSAVNRAYLTGNITCDVFVFEKPFGKFDRILQLIPPASRNVAIQKRFGGYALYMTYRSPSRIPLLVETFWNMSLRERDLKRLMLLTPNAPQVLLAVLIRDRFRDAYWNDMELSRLNMAALETLSDLDYRWGEMSKTYLALCLLSIDKTVRSYAAELWAGLVKKGKMDSVAVGRVLGEVETFEWSPVQRFVSLVTDEMMNISPLHNKELERMFVSFLTHLPKNPVKDLKRLLEAFVELLAVNQSRVRDKSLLSLLKKWRKNMKLTEIVEKCLDLE